MSELVLTDNILAAMVSEADDGGFALNGDGDAEDLVPHFWFLPPTPGASFNSGVAASAMQAEGEVMALLVPEAGQGNSDLTQDGDTNDEVIRLNLATLAGPVPIGLVDIQDGVGRQQPASDFSLGSQMLAFSTPELGFCNEASPATCSAPLSCAVSTCDLNGDGDCCDEGLQVYGLGGAGMRNTGSSVRPCNPGGCVFGGAGPRRGGLCFRGSGSPPRGPSMRICWDRRRAAGSRMQPTSWPGLCAAVGIEAPVG